MGGIRVSQPMRGAGTLGALVEDVNTGETLGLSCYHVVGDPGQASVYQPAEPPLVVGVTPSAADMIGGGAGRVPAAVGLLRGRNPPGLVPAGKIGVMCDIGNIESMLGVSGVIA